MVAFLKITTNIFDPATNVSSPAHADALCLVTTARLVLVSHTASRVSFQTDCDKFVDFTVERVSSFGTIRPVILSVHHTAAINSHSYSKVLTNVSHSKILKYRTRLANFGV